MSRAYRKRSWLDPRVEARDSLIEGRGLFAREPIAAGEVLVELGGEVLTDAQVRALRPHSSLALGGGRNLMQAHDDPAQFGNHSCDSNLWLHDEVTVETRRDAGRGEELTIDYALMTGISEWSMDCRCGAPGCRAIVTGGDWLLQDVQERYRGHFSPFLNQRIGPPR